MSGTLIFSIALLIAAGVAYLVLSRLQANQIQRQVEDELKRYETFLAEVDRIVDRHLPTLASKYKQMAYYDEYDQLRLEAWTNELDRFIETFVAPLARNNSVTYDLTEIRIRISEAAINEQASNAGRYSSDVTDGDGESFENHCKDQLEALGLEVRKTKRGADQGVDLIADHRDFRAAIQCKNYTRPVGNKAVQEVLAGASFYSPPAAIPVVISKSGFTPSARQLAKGAEVLLIDAHDLETFDILLIGEALSRSRSAI